MFSKTFEKYRRVFEEDLSLPISVEASELYEKVFGRKAE